MAAGDKTRFNISGGRPARRTLTMGTDSARDQDTLLLQRSVYMLAEAEGGSRKMLHITFYKLSVNWARRHKDIHRRSTGAVKIQ